MLEPVTEPVRRLIAKYENRIERLEKANGRLCEQINSMPEIVRCRDCKHLYIPQWDEILAAEYGAPPIVCERTGDMDDVEPDGFCAWGERKEVTR